MTLQGKFASYDSLLRAQTLALCNTHLWVRDAAAEEDIVDGDDAARPHQPQQLLIVAVRRPLVRVYGAQSKHIIAAVLWSRPARSETIKGFIQ